MELDKIRTIQETGLEELKKESLTDVKEYCVGSSFILSLDIRKELSEFYKSEIENGVNTYDKIDFTKNDGIIQICKTRMFELLMGAAIHGDHVAVIEKLTHLFKLNIDDLIVTNEMSNDEFFQNVWKDIQQNS